MESVENIPQTEAFVVIAFNELDYIGHARAFAARARRCERPFNV